MDEVIPDIVAGERRADLLRALKCISTEETPDGDCVVDGELPADVAPAFIRALMRVEAELLLHDADRITAGVGAVRTADERRADAFVALLLRAVDDTAH
jgi:hypothetical protein